ncbi:MAG: AbrB/MazE/SpoVT family DNA-binding domain-containing protein [Pseudomonadota bacterium]
MPDDQSKPDTPETLEFEVTINDDGRLVVPKAVRELMGVDGEKATLRLKADRTGLTIRSRIQGLRYAQALFQAHANVPDGVSLVDEFIAERRAEAAREIAEIDASMRGETK